MERITVKCPNCENRMEIDPKVIAFRCSKCGEKIDLDSDPVKQGPIIANINIDRREAVQTVVDKADLLRAKNEYKLGKKRLRQENGGEANTLFKRRERPEVVYREKKVGFGAAIVGCVKWLMIGMVAMYIVHMLGLSMR